MEVVMESTDDLGDHILVLDLTLRGTTGGDPPARSFATRRERKKAGSAFGRITGQWEQLT